MNIDRGLVNAVVFLDLKKAFDTVDHNILPMKLHYYGLRGSCHEWFTSYLSNCTQTCLINTSMSTPKSVKCGVPQGTILGPLLFPLSGANYCLLMTCPGGVRTGIGHWDRVASWGKFKISSFASRRGRVNISDARAVSEIP